MKIRLSNTRGTTSTTWINSKRSFSNNSYYDANYMNWNSLNVINDDTLQPTYTIPLHLHKNMDILGYMIEGKLEHTDSLGNINTVESGQIQHMSCGSGISHTERCVSTTPAKYLQIWFTPTNKDTTPKYETITKTNEYGPVQITLDCNMTMKGGTLTENQTITTTTQAYLFVVSGTVTGNGFTLNEGDSVELTNESITADFNSHIVLFETK